MTGSCEPRRRDRRLAHADVDLRGLPRRTEDREEVAVESDVARGLPGEDQEDAEAEQDRVRAGAAREHEVQVHERAADRGDADERTEDEAEADRRLAEGDQLAEEN